MKHYTYNYNIRLRKRKAQSFLDYSICIAIVVAAFIGTFFIFKYYTAARIRTGVDTIGLGEQYQP